jgi:hypothetical protein
VSAKGYACTSGLVSGLLSVLFWAMMKDNYTMTLIRRFKYELIVVLIWGIAVASKILYNGLVFGFDYGT